MQTRFPESLQAIGLAKYLSEDDQLAVRAVSKTMRKLMAEWQAAPYNTKKHFVLGVSGVFTQHVAPNLSHAWANYQYTLQSCNNSPAVLYKLSDNKHKVFLKQRQKIWDYSAYLKLEGLIYVPPKRRHCWAQNQVWVLAQIHKQRAFEVLSNVSERNFKRQQDASVISAFAKEATMVMQAGYVMHISAGGNIILMPPTQLKTQHASLPRLSMSAADTRQHYDRLKLFSQQEKIPPNKVPHTLFGLFTLRLKEKEQPKEVLQSEFELQDFSK